jgi:hypothetical protein
MEPISREVDEPTASAAGSFSGFFLLQELRLTEILLEERKADKKREKQ